MVVTVAVAFISVVSGVLWRFRSTGFAWAWCEVSGCCCYLMCVPLHEVVVLLCLGRPDQFSECFSVFYRPPLPFVFITLLLLLLLLLVLIITLITISTELLALCDRCLGWGWVWLAGLVAGCG